MKQPDTFLPHWGYVKRALHSVCKESRFINTVVSGLEMRFGVEEVVSMPQFMAVCPTGQCNAICSFCSVTTNRDGITKKQLPFDKMVAMIAPARKTVHSFGVEGNGEPTLYDQFDEMINLLTDEGAKIYLITNGERLTGPQIDKLTSGVTSFVNFSLNSATAATHRKVMGLKRFDTVVSNIKDLINKRPHPKWPQVSASFVVTADNVHEVRDFLRLAGEEIGVNPVMVRPLSEIANEGGSVEDTRSLVPYESDIRDMLESVKEYFEDVAPTFEVGLEPSNFKVFRQDPLQKVVAPTGYEGRLLAPRRGDWNVAQESVSASWYLDSVTISCGERTSEGAMIKSNPIPVNRESDLVFEAKLGCDTPSQVTVLILSPDGATVIAEKRIDFCEKGETDNVEIAFNTTDNKTVIISVASPGGAAQFNIDFLRLRSIQVIPQQEFVLPGSSRWEVSSPGAEVKWTGNSVAFKWSGEPSRYLLSSYFTECLQGEDIVIPLLSDIKSGSVGLGILTEDGSNWIQTITLEPGKHEYKLSINSGTNRKVRIVFFSHGEEDLVGSVTWTDGMAEAVRFDENWDRKPDSKARKTFGILINPIEGPITIELLQTKAVSAVKLVGYVLLYSGRKLKEFIKGPKIKYYCQKPWRDLNNLTVDGRLDVCCIATGESQKGYALGNMFTDKFQDSWNGGMARKFRKTVNTSEKLPPCERCPMAMDNVTVSFHYDRSVNRFNEAVSEIMETAPGGERITTVLTKVFRLFMAVVSRLKSVFADQLTFRKLW